MAMPRPTVAQFAYGSCTVILSTVAMLALSRTGSAVGIAVIAVAALALGLLVAVTVPATRARAVAVRRPSAVPAERPVPVSSGTAAGESVRQRAA
ncbi:hypothetical protein [Streptomyces fumanus]|uniref:hypothetical protein n=1 Tax=Streptomyces fumanus TaxID=67302 RepID=UPI0034077E4C